MANLVNGQVQYQGGEALPTVGSQAYQQAQNGVIPSAVSSQPITASLLNSNPKPVTLAPTPIPTATAGVLSSVEATNGQTASDLKQAQDYGASVVDQNKLAQEQNTNKSIFGQLTDYLTNRKGKTALTDQAYTQDTGLGTVDQTKQDLTDITNQINAKQLAYRRQIEEIQKNNTGAYGGGVQVAVNNVQAKAASELADLSVIQQAKSNNYANAKEIADRKVEAQLEDDKNQLDALQFFYQENKADLTKDEDRQFQATIDERKRLLDKTEADKKQVNDIAIEALKNGADQATSQKILNAKTPAEALGIGGKYVGLLDRQMQSLQREKIRQDILNNPSGGNGIGSDTGKANITADAEDILSGRNTLYNIRLQMGRTKDAAAYMLALRNEIRSKDNKFDFIASDAGSKFVSSEYYQKSITAINSVMPNLDKIVDLSNQVSRVGVAGVDSILQKGSVQIGNSKVANFRQAQKLVADEIGVALGAGTVSDMKLQLGFDVTDPSVSPEVFASNMGIVKEFIQNRKAALEGQRYSSSTVNSSSGKLTSPDGNQEVDTSTLTPAQVQEAKNAGWK